MKQNLVGEILGKIKSFGQDFVPIKTTLILTLHIVNLILNDSQAGTMWKLLDERPHAGR